MVRRLGTLVLAGLVLVLPDIVAGQGAVTGRFAEPVKITPAQAKLLLAEAQLLGNRSTVLSKDVVTFESKGDFSGLNKTFTTHLANELTALDKTRVSFLNEPLNDLQRQAAQVLFNDFQRRYNELSSELKGFQPAIYKVNKGRTLQILDEHERAYRIIAMTGSETFNLVVNSAPFPATVEYKRVGDNYRRNNDPTNTVLNNLGYAIWVVRATLNGKQQEKEHNPFRESNHALFFDFTR